MQDGKIAKFTYDALKPGFASAMEEGIDPKVSL